VRHEREGILVAIRRMWWLLTVEALMTVDRFHGIVVSSTATGYKGLLGMQGKVIFKIISTTG
jgi:hypothetical protein